MIFRVFFPHAAGVSLVGTFTQWSRRPVAMTRQFPGWWVATVPVPAGSHAFAYNVDGVQVADFAAEGVEQDAAGKWVSRLTVAGADSLIPESVIEAKSPPTHAAHVRRRD